MAATESNAIIEMLILTQNLSHYSGEKLSEYRNFHNVVSEIKIMKAHTSLNFEYQ